MKIFLSLYFISSHEVQRSAIPSLKKYINAKNLDVSKLYQVYHIFSKNGWRELCIKHFTNDFIFLDFVGFIRKSSDGLYRGIYLSFSWGKTMILKKGGGEWPGVALNQVENQEQEDAQQADPLLALYLHYSHDCF